MLLVTSSFFNGILISVLDCTGPSVAFLASPVTRRLSIDISSCITGTSTVLVSVSGSFVIVPSCAESLLDTSNFSSVNGTAVSSASPIVLPPFMALKLPHQLPMMMTVVNPSKIYSLHLLQRF